MEVLKKFAYNSTTSSLKQRNELFDELFKVLSDEKAIAELPEASFKSLGKLVYYLFPIYIDKKSKSNLIKYIDLLINLNFEQTAKVIVQSFETHSKSLITTHPNRSTSTLCFYGIDMINSILIGLNRTNGKVISPNSDLFKNLTSVYANFAFCACNDLDAYKIQLFYKKFQRLCKLIPNIEMEFANTIKDNSETNAYSLLFVYFLLKHFTEQKSGQIESLKDTFLDVYLKHILGARTKLPAHVIKSSNLLLKYVTRDDFKEKIMPAMQRSLLRNPEIVLELVNHLLNDVTNDLSDFANDLIKILGSQLLAKVEENQQETANAIKSLAKQCSDSGAVQSILKHLFHVLNGGEGKLSTASQKCIVLTAIGNVSFNCAVHNQDFLLYLNQQFNEFLNIETHEGTLLCALQRMNLWLSVLKFSGNVSDACVQKLNASFKKLLEIKSFSANVRSAIMQTMLTLYSKNSILHHVANFIPTLMQSIEKALNQHTHIHLLYEAQSASLLLASLLIYDHSLESKMSSFVNLMLDMKKQLFANEKFYANSHAQGLKDYCLLFSKLTTISTLKENFDTSGYLCGYIYALCHHSYEVRKTAQSVLKQLWKWNGCKLALQFLDASESMLMGINLSEWKPIEADEKNWPSSKGVCEALLTLVTIQNLTRSEIDLLALKCLLVSNSPIAKTFDSQLYKKCMHRLLTANNSPIKLTELIQAQTADFIQLTVNGTNPSESQFNSIETLSCLDGEKYLNQIVHYALDLLNDNNLKVVTKQEFEIMQLQDGELHDKTLIESALKAHEASSQANQNMKRENKAYSYKDQLAELELRKEIEKKKAINGQTSTVNKLTLDQIKAKLPKKQQEMLEQQIEREAKIRESVKKLDQVAHKASSILIKSIQGNHVSIQRHITNITHQVNNHLKSPLCASHVFEIYKELIKIVYPGTFGQSLVFCTFRLGNSPISVEVNWTKENVDVSAKRLLQTLSRQFSSTSKHQQVKLITSAFILPFVRFFIGKYDFKNDDNIDLIDLLMQFAGLRLNQLDAVLKQTTTVNTTDTIDCLIRNFPSADYMSLLFSILNKNNLTFRMKAQIRAIITQITQFTSNLPDGKENLDVVMDEFTELIGHLTSELVNVREICLECLIIMKTKVELLEDQSLMQLVHRVWVACYDEDENTNRKHAETVWTECGMATTGDLCLTLVRDDVVHPLRHLKISAGLALQHALKSHEDVTGQVLDELLDEYNEYNKKPEVKVDQFGRQSNTDEPIDNFDARFGIANALFCIADLVPADYVLRLFTFYVNKGLNDRNDTVRNRMLDASIACLNQHGKSHKEQLLTLFEYSMETVPKSGDFDAVRQNVVILMGNMAKHLDKDDPKIMPIIGKLVQALQTPSQQVQEAVANCLSPLMPSIKAQVPTYVNQLMNVLLSTDSYGERRGAAYGIAGMLKGLGMLSLRQLNILQRLNEAVNNKTQPKQREGALIVYEMLTIMFNKVFEPFSVEILPNLLLCFGDSDANVRQAADDCAKAIMSNLTFTGVKMILPKLLERLSEEESWRTKCGSVELLGAMAHCAPKQLGTCLPNIVPKLIEVLSDSHVKVQKAGTQALKQIGSVIKNPEILEITHILLEALQDPAHKTQYALQVLLDTKFVHFIDAASLALIMPVVHRAFQDRSTETRKMAAQIMGNMYSLTDQKDLQPYLPSVLPGLKQSLLDPVPEVRSVSAKALGAMIRAIGESGLNDIVSWLMEKLVSEVSSVDRSGAAQGLSEVFGALGVAKLDKSIPEIIERAEQTDLSPFVRDGYIMMFIYLPLTFTTEFTPYVGRILSPILKALADENEFVRDTALKAGQRIVNTYADTAISLFLPELEKGLFDSNWRIRYSSVQLLGDLLYKVSGVVGKMTTESLHEDDNFGTESGQKAIITRLGEERRNRVYAGLYMGRSDVSLFVRQAALHVWKVIVSNTPRTLKDILPTLFNLLLSFLASTNADKRQIAAATLVDIVRKLGERILPDIIPILENGLNSDRAEQRQGVCIGLTEIMSSTSKDNILFFSDSLIPTVRRALIDPLPEVRYYAAKTFDNLHNMIGTKALEEVGIYLLDEMKKADATTTDSEVIARSERALDGLKQIMMVKSRVMLPYLIPYLTQPPVNINVLCKLCGCASVDALSKHLSKILNTLVHALATMHQSNDWIRQECESLLLSIHDPDGVRTIVNELLHYLTHNQGTLGPNKTDNANTIVNDKLAVLDMLNWFCAKTKTDYMNHVDDLIRTLLNLFADPNDSIVLKAWDCLNSVMDSLKGTALIQRLSIVRQSMRLIIQQNNLTSGGTTKKVFLLRGFCITKKGISCILPIFKEGLLNGTPDIKEQSALTLCECIKVSDSESLKSTVMTITGPLIRVLGERYSWNVKSAVLDAIYNLLLKVDVVLKPFLPQLQPTFLKALNDPNRTVRLKSGYALSKLVFMNPKFDQIVVEVNNYIKNTDDSQVKETLFNALRLCLNNIGGKLQDDTKKQLLNTLKQEQYLYSDDQQIRVICAGCLSSLAIHLTDQDFDSLLTDILDYKKHSSSNWKYLHANIMLIAVCIEYNAKRLTADKYNSKVFSFISSCVTSDRTAICTSAMRAITFLLEDETKNNLKIETDMAVHLARCINNNSNDVKQLSVQLVTYLAANSEQALDSNLLKVFIPMLVNGTKERAPIVRSASEIALVYLLHINRAENIVNQSLDLMDKMRDPLSECIKSISKENVAQANMCEYLTEICVDETLLKIDS